MSRLEIRRNVELAPFFRSFARLLAATRTLSIHWECCDRCLRVCSRWHRCSDPCDLVDCTTSRTSTMAWSCARSTMHRATRSISRRCGCSTRRSRPRPIRHRRGSWCWFVSMAPRVTGLRYSRACGGPVGVAARWRVLARSRRASPAVAAYHRSARGAVRCLAVAVPHHGGAPDSNHRQHQRMLQAINRASRSSNWLIMRWLSCAYLVHREWRSQAVRCWHSRAISGCSRARPRSRSPRSRSVCRSQLASLYVRSNQ